MTRRNLLEAVTSFNLEARFRTRSGGSIERATQGFSLSRSDSGNQGVQTMADASR